MMMCLKALGHPTNEDEVNKVMGATPAKGAAWEQALATAQHYGCRATLTVPATVLQLKEWTDQGIPVMIAWNPEGRDWSHASVVFDVDEDLNVHVADPNMPDPDETVRVVSKGDFYSKWYEKWPKYLVRRPAMAVEREITSDGRQVMARTKMSSMNWGQFQNAWSQRLSAQRVAHRFAKNRVVHIQGKHRKPTARELARVGIQLPFKGRMAGRLFYTDFHDSEFDAEVEAEELEREKTSFPSGLSALVAVVRFDTQNEGELEEFTPWIGVVQTGHSDT
jgi:hypothetical protein